MNPSENSRLDELYQRHLRMLKLQRKSKKAIDSYARAVRRVAEHFDCCPDEFTLARVFRTRFLDAVNKAGLSIAEGIPEKSVR